MPKRYPPHQESIPCIGCGSPLKKLDIEDKTTEMSPERMIDGGNLVEVYCGYGSNQDTYIYLIGVCDDCLQKRGIKIGEYF